MEVADKVTCWELQFLFSLKQQKRRAGRGYRSVVREWPTICQSVGSIPSNEKNKNLKVELKALMDIK